MSDQTSHDRWGGTVAVVALMNVAIGVVAYVVVFVVAYGFRDEVTLAQHVTFLVGIAVVAAGTAALALPAAMSMLRTRARPALPLVVATTALVHLAAVASGVVVSSQHKAEGSVTAGFSTTEDVVVPAVLYVLAVVALLLLLRTRRGGRV